MDKPRRRAAGRPAGPPNVVVEPAVVERKAVEPPAVEQVAAEQVAERAAATAPDQAETTGPVHRRRQRSARQTDRARDTASAAAPALRPEPSPPPNRQSAGHSSGRDDRRRGESQAERSLRALVSTRTTQLPPDIAMRAREVAAPTAADLAEAEQDLVIVRRYYVPPAPWATGGKTSEQAAADGNASQGRGRASEGKHGGRRS